MPKFDERYEYDGLGHLAKVRRPDGEVRCTWDARGHRVKVEVTPEPSPKPRVDQPR